MKFPTLTKARLVMVALILTFAISGKQVEKLGDSYQIALPVIALGCSVTNGQAWNFFGRYLVQLVLVHGSKYALGDAQINLRPNGNTHGMPSGHSATAALGASNLVHECLGQNPWVKGAVILTAGFVGGSRIESNAHDIWQVMAGILVGWGCDRAFRKASPIARWRQFRGWLKTRLPRSSA